MKENNSKTVFGIEWQKQRHTIFEVIVLYYKQRQRAYRNKKQSSNAIIIMIALIIVAIGGLAMKNEIEAQKVKSQPMENHTDNYNSSNNSSQGDNAVGANVKPDATPKPIRKATPQPSPSASPKPSPSPARSVEASVKPSASATPNPTTKPSEQENYYITIYNGQISVFKNDEARPFLNLDVDLEQLTQEDIALLEAGITLSSMGEVKAFIEDYD